MWRTRFTRIIALRRYFPFSGLGIAAVAVSGWCYRDLSREASDVVLGTIALGALALIALCFIGAAATTLWLRRRLRMTHLGSDLNLESGVATTTGFSYADLSRWPLFQVRMEWTRPHAVEIETQSSDGWEEEIITPRLRGRFAQITRRFWISDIFGFCRFTFATERAQRGLILPHRASLTRQGLRHISGGDVVSHPGNPPEGELLDMRRYAHGDPLRLVIWKIYGRTRQLLVRAPEQAITPSPNSAAYFVAGPEDEATASIARLYLEQGLLGRSFLFLADGANKPATVVADAMEQLINSAEHRHRGGAGAEMFFNRSAVGQTRTLLLFLPAHPGPWLARLRAAAARVPRVQVVIGYDIEELPTTRPWLSRLLFAPSAGRRSTDKHLMDVVREIAPWGWTIEVIHRPTGHIFSAAQVLEWAA